MTQTADIDLKSQRDRFLAFAFAGADLLIEINHNGKVVFASGAIKSLTNHEEKDFIGTNFADLFRGVDETTINIIRQNTKVGKKIGPYLVSIKNQDPQKEKQVFLSSFSIVNNGSIYVTVSRVEGLLAILGLSDKAPPIIASTEDFEEILRKKMPDILSSGQDISMQVLQLNGIESYKSKMDKKNWMGLMADISQLVMDSSIDGETAVKVDNEKFVLLKDEKNSEDLLQEKILKIAQNYNITESLNIQSKTIEGDMDSLSAREATRAILYTINKMEKDGLDGCDDNLNESFKEFLKENTNKISKLKNIISLQNFKINFQPIVYLADKKISHHEVLVRFEGTASPYDMIVMGEDVGIAPDIDLSICKQTLKYIDMNRKKTEIGKLAVNLSGASIQSDTFVDKLLSTLKEHPEAAAHLTFEITESSEITDLDKVNNIIQKLRKNNHAVCLDDFGAGAASFQYLQKLHVDGIKIDGAYVKSILSSPRDASMVKNITKMCHELDVYVVAEMIETEEQWRFLNDLGVDKGQGWLFGKPLPDPLSTI